MYQPIILYIGLRYMHGRSLDSFGRFVSWLSIIGIILGIIALVVILSVMNGFEHELEKNVLKLMPQALLTTSEGNFNPKCIPSSAIDSLKGITRITSLTTGDVVLQSAHSVSTGVMLGINPWDPEPLSNYLLETRQDNLIAGKYRVILGDKLASALSVKKGDTIRLIVLRTRQFTPIGRIPSQRLFTVDGTFSANSEVDSYQLLVNQQDASRLMRYSIGYITGWRLWLQQPLTVEKLSTQSLPKGLIWHDWRERKGELFQAIHMEKNMMSLLLSLIVIVSAFNIIISLALRVMEKQAEIAILQTQGMTKYQIMLIFVTQGVSAGIIGVFLGTSLGILLASQLNHVMPVLKTLFNVTVLPVIIESVQIVVIALSSIAVALLSTIYPSWHAADVHPAKALQYE